METRFETHLKSIYARFGWKKGLVLVCLGLGLLLLYRDIITLGLLIAMAAGSKFYHRLFKSTLGIDLVFFAAVYSSYKYGMVAGLIVGWISLVLADIIGGRINYTSLISFIGLTIVAMITPGLSWLPLRYAGIIAALMFEILVAPLYLMMGSSPGRIAVFVSSHLVFNTILFFNFT